MHDGAVEQDLELEGRLEPLHSAHRAARRSPQLRANLVLGVGREVVIDDEPAAGAVRQPFDPVVLREVEPRPVLRPARRELGVAHRHGGHAQPDREVALEQQRRSLQRIGDVVEAVARDVRGQQRFDVDGKAEQVPNRIAVRRARQPAHGRAGRLGRGGVESRRKIGHEARDGFVARPRLPGRRHEPRAELMNYRFPFRALRGRVREVRILEHEVRLALRSAVAIRAVLAHRRAVLGGQLLRRRRAGCQRRCGKAASAASDGATQRRNELSSSRGRPEILFAARAKLAQRGGRGVIGRRLAPDSSRQVAERRSRAA